MIVMTLRSHWKLKDRHIQVKLKGNTELRQGASGKTPQFEARLSKATWWQHQGQFQKDWLKMIEHDWTIKLVNSSVTRWCGLLFWEPWNSQARTYQDPSLRQASRGSQASTATSGATSRWNLRLSSWLAHQCTKPPKNQKNTIGDGSKPWYLVNPKS